MSVRNLLREAEMRLAEAGVGAPDREAARLLGRAWGIPWLEVWLQRGSPPEKVLARFSRSLGRRARREPVQYVTGTSEFHGFTFRAGPGALIPRPETEALVDAGLGAIAARARIGRPVRVLELGVGTGAVILSLCVERSDSDWMEWIGTDISPEALALARENAEALGLADRVRFLQGDLFGPVAGEAPFDLILFNPPYIATSEIEALAPEVRCWEPRSALDGGADGLDFYRRLAAETPARVRPGGALLVEIGAGQRDAVSELFRAGGLRVLSVTPDASGIPRVIEAANPRP